MRKNLAILFAITIWFAVAAQFCLMLANKTASTVETIIRFFSFFTILTNTLAAVYFTNETFKGKFLKKAGTLTAITAYITIVGSVYQLVLRQLWQPAGLQKVADELLHTINPLLVILFWYLYEKKELVNYSQIFSWLIYLVFYLIYILLRGSFSGFYPYPFVNVLEIDVQKTLINSLFLLLFFVIISFVFISIGKLISRRKTIG